jgi:F-type H+-transporting ATPase subunit b
MEGETPTTSEAAPAAGETTAHTEVPSGAHGGEHKVFPPFDPSTFASQLVWLAITFGLLYWLLAKVAIPRLEGIIEGRKGRISGDLDAAGRAKSQSEDAIAGYEKALAEARANAGKIAEAAREEAKAAAATKRAATEADLARQLSQAEARIADIKKRALAEVNVIAGETASAVVASLADIDAPRQDIDQAVSAALAK